MRNRNTERYHLPTSYLPNVIELARINISNGVYVIGDSEQTQIDIMINPEPNASTIIFYFSPALTNSKATVPYFVGVDLLRGLNAHRVYLSDPALALHDDVTAGWFLGHHDLPNLQQQMHEIIKTIQTALGARHVVFVGGSSGGFAAMYFAANHEGSLAMVVNPQTNVLNYHQYHVARYARHAWGLRSFEQVARDLPKRVCTNLCTPNFSPQPHHVLYLQNANDEHHVINHLAPFARHPVGTRNVRVILGQDWGMGHIAAPKETQQPLLDQAIKSDGSWDSFFAQIADAIPLCRVPSL